GYERNGGLLGNVWDAVVFNDGSGPAIWACSDSGRVLKYDTAGWREVGRAYGSTSGVAGGFTYKLAVCDPDGPGPLGDQLWVCGGFRRIQGPVGTPMTASGVARWTGSGWLDEGPPAIAGGLYLIRAMTAYNDGSGKKIVVANEDFPGSVGMYIRDHGGSWSVLDPGLTILSTDELNVVYAFDDGAGEALYVGGLFEGLTSFGVFTPSPGVIKRDETGWVGLGAGVQYHTGEGGRVYGLTSFDDGSGPRLYASGNIHSSGGDTTVRGVARWNGATWTGIGADYTLGLSGPYVKSIDLGPGPSLCLNGPMGVLGTGVAKWTGGTSWLNLDWAATGQSVPLALAGYDADGSGIGPARLVGLRTQAYQHDGSAWSVFPNHPASNGLTGVGRLQRMDVDGAGPAAPALYAFSNSSSRMFTAGGVAVNRIGRFDGTAWTSAFDGLPDLHVNLGGDPTNEGQAACAAVFDSGSGPQFYVGGWFTHNSGQVMKRVIRWNGTGWEEVGGGLGNANAYEFDRVWVMPTFNDGTGEALYACGTFTQAGGTTVSNIAKWNGTAWADVGGGVSGGSNAIRDAVVFDDGSGPALYVGGSFTTAGGSFASNVARWNGTSWEALGGGLNNEVLTLHVHDDGTGPALYAGGRFTSPATGVAKWSGTGWVSVGGSPARGNGFTGAMRVSDLATLNEGSGPLLVAAGQFELFAGTTVNHIARWDGGSWTGFNGGAARSGIALAASVEALAVVPSGSGSKMYAAGVFDFIGGRSSQGFAEWKRSVPADFNNSGTVSVQDIFDFLAAYFTGDPRADFNRSGTISVQDIFDYLSAYFVGCP
ncbi:MAG: GC-type dockerin domain-anchored protein, partial [Phycisphaerales bacterium]